MKILLVMSYMFLALFASCTRTTVADAGGNIYHTVRIGSQIWTVENLRTTKLNDGTPIPQVTDSVAWHSLNSPGYCYYRNTNNPDTIGRLGALYNWYCVDSKKLAPLGWHVPTNDDWAILEKYLIAHGYNWDRKKDGQRIAKSLAAQSGWKSFEIEGTPGNKIKDNNRSGFSGLAAGSRYDTHDSVPGSLPCKATFLGIRQRGFWWSATQVNEPRAFVYALASCVESLMQYGIFFKTCGYSVRLVKDGN
jgi:uncharacterized protein (TIGR02145 family)